ncbi:MAG: right-handed parallel beta-helix repeat-containing protein [Planctomycetota bacterium]|nr:right-handed parallel beta-helix repeat-containing protein [Planctomycetota bacterium]
MKFHAMFRALTASLIITICLSSTGTAEAGVQKTLHVSPSGSDKNPGTEAKPFQTIQRARDEVRKVNRNMSGDIEVMLRGGTYQLGKKLVFDSRDGGTDEYKVTYRAFPEEKVVISGGRRLWGWKPADDGMWTLDLPEVRSGSWWFRQLFADGERMPRGRYPRTGYLKIKNRSSDFKTLEFEQPLPDIDLGGRDAEVVVIENWSIAREIIDSSSANSLKARTPVGWLGHSACLPKPGMSAFLEHSLSFVKKPGQWYLNRANGRLHYKAAEGENPNRRQFVAPALEQLVKIEGSRREPVRNLHFRDIRFAHAAWKMPRIGYAGIQACYYGKTLSDGIAFAASVAIELTRAEDCSLRGCRLSSVGGSGLGLGAGCRRNKIVGCEIADIGGNGLMVGYMPKKQPHSTDWSDLRDAPAGNEISNCYVHHCGATLFGGVGIFDAMTQDTRIAHNEVAHLPYTGISTGYIWNTAPTSQKNCLIACNHVHDVMELLYDGGTLYTLGFQPGSIIRDNLMHGVRRSKHSFGHAPNNGIFFDQGSKGFLVSGNVIYDTADKPIRFNQCKREWQTWRENSLGIAPDDPRFPRKTAANAGLQTPWKTRLKK